MFKAILGGADSAHDCIGMAIANSIQHPNIRLFEINSERPESNSDICQVEGKFSFSPANPQYAYYDPENPLDSALSRGLHGHGPHLHGWASASFLSDLLPFLPGWRSLRSGRRAIGMKRVQDNVARGSVHEPHQSWERNHA